MSSMNHTITAGLILVMSIVMAYVVQVVGDLFDFTDAGQLEGLVETLPVLIVIIGLIGSFVVLARTARSAGRGGVGGGM